jgi:8-oxo-dGTP diphosphatase
MSPANPVVVTAAVIERDGSFLVTRRPEGTHLAGHWEFPGGKCEGVETPESCLRRELREELDVEATVGEEMFRTRYRYDTSPGGLSVELRFFRCTLSGAPRPLLGQQMRWVPRRELSTLAFPPADAEFIAQLSGGRR